jgi:co-chaperonin GroES (HSP10)
MKIVPIGSRIFVEDLEPVDEVSARARAAGLYVVVAEENKPKPSCGRVVALGSDPLIHELIAVGDLAFYGWYAGMEVQVEGKTYRSLELREIISVAKHEEPPTLPPDQPTLP